MFSFVLFLFFFLFVRSAIAGDAAAADAVGQEPRLEAPGVARPFVVVVGQGGAQLLGRLPAERPRVAGTSPRWHSLGDLDHLDGFSFETQQIGRSFI